VEIFANLRQAEDVVFSFTEPCIVSRQYWYCPDLVRVVSSHMVLVSVTKVMVTVAIGE
jgi:hypothetical protein